MITLGVDLASQPQKTAACVVNWRRDEAIVETLETGVSDDRLLDLASGADKVGVDVPFGWPEAFVKAVTAHHAQQAWILAPGDHLRLRLRRTDIFVHRKTGKWPLSVSTDKIAIPALRAVSLMCRLAASGSLVDRIGSGKFVEVYPAAALMRWNVAGSANDSANLIGSLQTRIPGLKVSEEACALCSQNRDASDSVVAALIARAAALNLCEPIPEDDLHIAAAEGWIALPVVGSLPQRLGPATPHKRVFAANRNGMRPLRPFQTTRWSI
jgi:hypothetical protein